jgi:hypothetical protein
MNETIGVIQNRRSIRAFQDKPIDPAAIDLIIEATIRSEKPSEDGRKAKGSSSEEARRP